MMWYLSRMKTNFSSTGGINMKALSENEIISTFTGYRVNAESLSRCAHKNREVHAEAEYIIYSCGFLYDPALREQFGVTGKMKDLWERRGTEFNVYVYVADGVISSCHISKYRESDGARASYNSLKCTQQELRIAQRILSYIT